MNMPALVVLFAASSVAAQQRTIEPKDVQVFNRSVSALSDGTRKGVRLNEQPGEGVAYLKGIEFSNGTIEFDVRGNAWFHVRVVVASPKVSVFVGDAKQPSLVVTQLSDRTKGLVGLWVGNGSGGDFADLKIIPH